MEQTSLKKTLVGTVVSDGMTKTVSVQVTTFKVHPLYHKRYRWTKKYLADTGELAPKLGDTVKIEAHRPISARKRWIVIEVAAKANAVEKAAVKTAARKRK